MTDPGGAVTRATCVSLDDLSDGARSAWRAMRESDPRWASPFFDPGFADAVHRSGRPVRVVLAGPPARPTGVWPVHVERRAVRPVGWPAADFQGPIGEVDAHDLLRATGARSLHFDHLCEGLSGLTPFVRTWSSSPYLDVTGGLEGYLARASRSGRDNMSQARRKVRKAQERYGAPVVFTLDDRSPAALDLLVELKRGQYAASGARDYFARSERREMLRVLHGDRVGDFGGLLSTLRCGDDLLAAHFGLVGGSVLHWWFPAYDPGAADLSPGWMLLRELTMAAPSLGVTRIDLGRGEDEYKRRAMTDAVRVGEGVVAGHAAARVIESLDHRLRDWVRSSGYAPAVRRALGGGQ